MSRDIAFFGSSLVSAYWNGAATYYRGVLQALAANGHRITFYEPDAFDRQKHRDIPEGGERALTPQPWNALFEQPIEDADTARLDQEIGVARLFESSADTFFGRWIDNDARPIRIGNVAMLLPVECIGLVKGDAMSVGGERLQYAAIVGGGAVPIRRDKTRPEKGDVAAHCAAAISRGANSRPRRRQIAMSSSTR